MFLLVGRKLTFTDEMMHRNDSPEDIIGSTAAVQVSSLQQFNYLGLS